MSGHADRRPWLILSRREAEALLEALANLERYDLLNGEMTKAGAQLRKQLAWISGHDVDPPSVDRAIEREQLVQ
jgi:hypothetical protein